MMRFNKKTINRELKRYYIKMICGSKTIKSKSFNKMSLFILQKICNSLKY